MVKWAGTKFKKFAYQKEYGFMRCKGALLLLGEIYESFCQKDPFEPNI